MCIVTLILAPFVYSQAIDSAKKIIKNNKVEQRFIHPKSKYISISAGFGFTSTHVEDPNNFLNNGLIMQNNTYFPSVMYEHGIENNFFVELGYSYIGQGISYRRKIDEVGSFSYSGFYSNHDFQLGAGFRVINSKNYHFLNLHAGMFIGLANDRLVELPVDYTYNKTDPITDLNYTLTTSITHFSPITFGPYIGASKEIRLSEDLRFFVKYTHRIGLNSIMSGTFVLNSDDMNFNHDATFNVRGGGAFISAGLKVLLFKNKLNKNE